MLTLDLKTLIFVFFLLLLLAIAAGGYWLARRRRRSSVMLGDGAPLLAVLDDAPFGVAALNAVLDWPGNVWMGVTVFLQTLGRRAQKTGRATAGRAIVESDAGDGGNIRCCVL